MASIMVHIRINKELKEEACTNLELMGLSLLEAVRLLLVRIVTERVEVELQRIIAERQNELEIKKAQL